MRFGELFFERKEGKYELHSCLHYHKVKNCRNMALTYSWIAMTLFPGVALSIETSLCDSIHRSNSEQDVKGPRRLETYARTTVNKCVSENSFLRDIEFPKPCA